VRYADDSVMAFETLDDAKRRVEAGPRERASSTMPPSQPFLVPT
jgi:hypothetical protein